jgi:hypothetical protein
VGKVRYNSAEYWELEERKKLRKQKALLNGKRNILREKGNKNAVKVFNRKRSVGQS